MIHTLCPTPRRAAAVRVTMLACAAVASIGSFAATARAQYEAPASYYASITTQTGASLKSQLTTIMSSGHVQTDYDDARDYLPFTDAVPDDPTKMYEYYTRVVINKGSASKIGFVGIYNSREHVWPDSQQGNGDTSGGTKGSRGDIHMLKPLSSAVNGDRGNKEYGGIGLSGAARTLGSDLWYPGDYDRGDAARIAFYADTRWGSTLKLVDGFPTANNQLGDKQALLRFHYLDVPDLFERRRNDTIYRGDDVRTSGDDSPFAGTKNRNAYIDHPEYVWSVFVDQQNDTRLTIAGADATDANAGSTKTINFGRVLRNAATPGSQTITVNKDGVDGTYYAVTTSGKATSSVSGPYNAFAMDATGSRQITVGLNASTATPGLQSGTVTIDNLDVTTQGGAGRGANDADDLVNLQLSVLAPSNGSFSEVADLDSLDLDFGTVAQAAGGSRTRTAAIANLASGYGAAFTAGLDLDAISSTGDAAAFASNLSTFKAMAAGASSAFTAAIDASDVGSFSATYTLRVSDEDLPGTQTSGSLTLTLHGKVALGGDADYSGTVDFADLLALAKHYNTSDADWSTGDFNADGVVSFDDLLTLAKHYNQSATPSAAFASGFAGDWALAQAIVPEPGSMGALMVLGWCGAMRRRGRRA